MKYALLINLLAIHKHPNYWVVQFKDNKGTAAWIDYRKENNNDFKYLGPFKTLKKAWKILNELEIKRDCKRTAN